MSSPRKFRAWDEDCEVMYYSDQEYDDCYFGFHEGKVVAWLRETEPQTLDEPAYDYGKPIDVMQYTGLEDKDRVEIWEDDLYKDAEGIISWVAEKLDGWGLFPVKKDVPVRSLYWRNICNATKGTVIGNRHQHPQLLEEANV